MITSASNIDFRHNSLTLFRIIACVEVMLGHASLHLCLSLNSVLSDIIHYFHGVPIFFFLSGFFIWMSIDRTPDTKSFFTKRVLRLYPELWICVIIEIASIILFYKQHVPMKDYLLFGFTQGTLFQFWTPDSLRGYGCSCPNGSLWTITVIVQFYVVIWICRKLLKNKSFVKWGGVILASVLCGIFFPVIRNIVPEVAYKLLGQTLIPYAWLFLIGCFLCNFSKEIIPTLMKYWYVPLLLGVVIRYTDFDINAGLYPVAGSILLSLFILGFAYRFPSIKIKKDISYGIYIYHMIFVNIAIALGYIGNSIAYICVVVATILIAYVSYEIVGGFSRKKKKTLVIEK